MKLVSEDESKRNSSRELMVKPVPNEAVLLDVSTSTACAPFDRTTVVAFAPQLIVENFLEEAVVIWQRGTSGPHTKWLEPSQACAFYPEGDIAKCRMSVNLASLDSDELRDARAVFSPMQCSNEPVLLECSDRMVILAETVPVLVGNVSTYMLRLREPSEVVPHKIVNLTHYSLGFKQLNSKKALVTQVRPWQSIKMVWPEPLKPKMLQLVEVDGQPVKDSAGASDIVRTVSSSTVASCGILCVVTCSHDCRRSMWTTSKASHTRCYPAILAASRNG